MRGKKLVQRLNAITEVLETHGVGNWCDCPHLDDANIERSLASKLGIEFVERPIVECSEHRPRPLRKPKVDPGFVWRLVPNLTEAFEQEISSARKPALTNGRLKASSFAMADYV